MSIPALYQKDKSSSSILLTFLVIYLFAKSNDHSRMIPMKREDVRRENARMLAKQAGGFTDFAKLTGMENSQVSQIIGKNPVKNIGNIVAARIERAFGLPTGALDVAPQPQLQDGPVAEPITITPMHEQMVRLYTAARQLRGISTQAELARALNQSSQVINNWEARGISKIGMLDAQRVLGCSATWLATGEGEMTLSIPTDPVVPGALRVVATDVEDEPLPSRVRIPKVRDIRLSAGLSGVSVEYDRRDDGVWDVPRRWIDKGRFVPECLYAIEVHGESMEPNYYEGDVVVIDTADRALVSGHVYAVNCDGEPAIKRLIKEGMLWYLYSDNPLPRFHKVAVVAGKVEIIGKIVLRQTYHVS